MNATKGPASRRTAGTGSAPVAPDVPDARPPAAVLWDMDGTLVDTEDYWIEAADELVRRFVPGARLEHTDALIGLSLPAGAALMREAGVPLSIEEIVDLQLDRVIELVRERGFDWRPGAVDLLSDLDRAGVPLALVTMSYRRFAEGVAELVPGRPFDLVVAGDDVANGKPDPEAYLLAAERLGVDIGRCVVIEDSLVGLAAGRASGATTIGVPCHVELPATVADAVWPTLEGRRATDLRLPPAP